MRPTRYIYAALAIGAILFNNFTTSGLRRPKLNVEFQVMASNFRPVFVGLFSMGHKKFFSSLLWIKTMIDSDITHYVGNDLQSWMYLRFNTITELNPKFYDAYVYGGLYLSVIKDDDLGAQQIYLKGLGHFPDDIDLNFQYGFHAYKELEDVPEAIKHFERVLNSPKGEKRYAYFLPSLVSKLKANGQDLEGAYTIMLKTYEMQEEGGELRKRLGKGLYSLKAEIDLKCLNGGSKECSRTDFFGDPYIYASGRYMAKHPWKPFRTTKRPKE